MLLPIMQKRIFLNPRRHIKKSSEAGLLCQPQRSDGLTAFDHFPRLSRFALLRK